MPHKGIREKGQVSPKFIIAAVAGAVLLAAAYFFIVPSGSQPEAPQPPPEVVEKPEEGGLAYGEVQFTSFENNILLFRRGNEVLTLEYNPAGGAPLQKKVGPRFLPITPEEITPGSTVTLYTSVIDGEEVITGVLVR